VNKVGNKVAQIEESRNRSKEIAKPRAFRQLAPRKRWAAMSPAQRAANLLLAAVDLAMLILALLDIRRRPAGEIKGSKRMWAAVALIQPFGSVIYFIFGRKPGGALADRQLLPV
jgi:Phospholipase_D-nuclease N-terminal